METKNSVVIGVDGGGTKTNIVCIDHSSKAVLGQTKTTSTNWNSVGAQVAKKTLTEGIKDCLNNAKCSTEQGTFFDLWLIFSRWNRPRDVWC
jgi:N-acetylglucosamine kinase-like BadF-type ATPase